MNPFLMIAIGLLAMCAVMAILWLVQRKTGDAGIVDVAWGMGVGLIALFFCWGSAGDMTRRMIVATLAMCWAVRLSAYVLYRVLTLPEDGRYTAMKEKWGDQAQAGLFRFYQYQALASVLFALPMLFAARSAQPIGLLDYLGVSVWVVAIVGEAVADYQLSRFRKNKNNRGKVCRVGLWNYSRHPNYFFEWVHWWSYVCFAILAPFGWLTILFPMLMLYFILTKTGIPPTEEHAIKSRGEAYREYQRTTSAFFPWPPKQAKSITVGQSSTSQTAKN